MMGSTEKFGDSRASAEFFAADVLEARRFFNPPEEDEEESLVVVSGGVERCEDDYVVERHGFLYFALELVLFGNGKLILAGQDFDLIHGTLFSYGPGIPHSIRADGSAGMVKYFIDFTGRLAESMLEEAGLPPGSVVHVSEVGMAAAIFDEMIWTGRLGGPRCRRAGALSLERLLLLAAETSDDSRHAEKQSYETYLRCRKIIEALPARTPFDMAEVAARCHVDQAYLCRLFSRFAGKSPGRFLREQRIADAAKELLRPGAMVKSVAAAAGFSDQFSFSRAFKAAHRMSPREFMAKANKKL